MEAILKREIIVSKKSCQAIGVAVFVILTALGAFVRIPLPFSPVPVTLQTFFVLLSGAFLGSRLGGITQLSYLFIGFLGLPIFTGAGSGAGYLLGPTGGYLAGFIFAAVFLGHTVKKYGGSFLSLFCLFCIADAILLLSGVLWLKTLFGYDMQKLLLIGFLPFVPADLIKAFFAAGAYNKFKSRLKEVF